MPDEIESLRAEVAALRARLEAAEGPVAAVSRRRLLSGAAAVGAATVAGVAHAAPASAADEDPFTLGVDNTATGTTSLIHEPVEDDTAAVELRTGGLCGLFVTTTPSVDPPLDDMEHTLFVAAGGNERFANAITAYSSDGAALDASSDGGVLPTITGANYADGPGVAAASFGHGPQLVLFKEGNSPTGPPTTWAEAGSIRFDGGGDLWLCLSTGAPGTWTRLTGGRTVPITPIRVLDTRATGGRPAGSPAVPGQKKGPLTGGSALTLDLAGVGPIPATASGVVGNLTVTSPTYNGYLIVGPSGTTPSTSALNFTTGATVANAFTSQLGPAGVTLRGSGTTSNRYELIVDITAYIS